MAKTYVYRDNETNELVTTFILIDITKEQAISDEYLPADTPMLEFNKGETVCAEDPKSQHLNCWKFDNESDPTEVILDLDKVKSKFMAEMRSRRNMKLATLDQAAILSMSMQKDDAVTEINAEKQLLRDLPSQINLDNVTELADFDELIPEQLKLKN